MRIRKSVAALALATGAAIGGMGLAGPAAASSGSTQTGLVNVYTQDIASNNQVVLLQNVSPAIAANVCGLDVDVLSADLLSRDRVACSSRSTTLTKSFVAYS